MHISNAFGLYALCQPVINEILPSSRRNNDLAKPLSRLDYDHLRPRAAMAGSVTDREITNDRYSAVNLQSIRVHGTLEFRQHSGTLNAAKVMHWRRLTKAIMRLGVTHSPEMLIGKGWDEYQDDLTVTSMGELLSLPTDTTMFYLKRQIDLRLGRDAEDEAANEKQYDDYYREECDHCGSAYHEDSECDCTACGEDEPTG
jgi:hypothetical protein